jgi:hypothetical protein
MQFLTYPRTGVNFLIGAIKIQTGIDIKYSHSEFIEKDDLLINIVRDPIDSIASWISMAMFRNELAIKNNEIEDAVNIIAKPKYIKMYNFLLSKENTVFINYQDITNADRLVEKLCAILDLKIIKQTNTEEINNRNLDKSKHYDANYLITSKTQPQYLEIHEKLKSVDFSQIYNLYNKALGKCIKI